MSATRVAVPARSPLSALYRVDGGWLVVTHSNDADTLSETRGTALLLRDDGTAARVVLRDNEGDDIWEIIE